MTTNTDTGASNALERLPFPVTPHDELRVTTVPSRSEAQTIAWRPSIRDRSIKLDRETEESVALLQRVYPGVKLAGLVRVALQALAAAVREDLYRRGVEPHGLSLPR
jgi:hypothetical protein